MVCDDKWNSVVRVLFFILDEVFSVNTTCFVKTMVNARLHLEITSPFWILTPPVKMVLCQLTYTTNRQINISTCPHRVVILNIAPKVLPRGLSNFWVSWRPRRVVLWKFYTVLGVFVWLSSAHERCWINYWAQDGKDILVRADISPSICLQWSVSKMWFETMYDVQKHQMHTTIQQHTYRRKIHHILQCQLQGLESHFWHWPL
jgi:hypothetical protein